MLGDIGQAEDVVQDAFARLLRANVDEIEDERGWLIVVTSRLCLDLIRSAHARRERAHDASEIEYVAPRPSGAGGAAALADPADRVTFDDSVRLALLVVLERLSPAERVVFVLHDIFRMPFDETAERWAVRYLPAGSSPAGPGRRSAPGKLLIASTSGPLSISLVTEKFIAACAGRDLDGLLAVLAPDAWGEIDLGPDPARRLPVTVGAEQVARNLLSFWGRPATLASLPVRDSRRCSASSAAN